MNDQIELSKKEFMLNELWNITLEDTIQRARVYTVAARKEQRQEAREFLISVANALVEEQYGKEKVIEIKHIDNIERLMQQSQQMAPLLNKGGLNFGVCQKLLNLHLKLRWVFGLIPEPPHFPIDRKIQEHIGSTPVVSWSSEMDRGSYEDIVEQVRILAKKKNMSLAAYELIELGKM